MTSRGFGLVAKERGDSGIGKMTEVQFQATVVFRDVAAYFLEKEWTCLEEGKKELYKKAMENIHLVIISLGHTIANPDVLIKIKADAEEYAGDPQSPGMECLDQYSASSQTTKAPDILLRISTDEVPQICKQEPPSADSQNEIMPESVTAISDAVVCYDHDYGTKAELQSRYNQIVNFAKSSLTDSVPILWNSENLETSGEIEVMIPSGTPSEQPTHVVLLGEDIKGPQVQQGVSPQVKSETEASLKTLCALANMRKIAPKAVPETTTVKIDHAAILALARKRRTSPPKVRPDIRTLVKIQRIAPKGGLVPFSDPGVLMVEAANVEPSTITVETADVEPSTITVETANVGPSIILMPKPKLASAWETNSKVFGVIYSMFNMNPTRREQMRHIITADEIARRFAEPERFTLRYAQRYLRQQKRGIATVANKCQQNNLKPNATSGVVSAWTLITEGDVKYLLESTQALASEYWPAKEIARHLSHISQSSSSRALQLEHTRDFLESLHSCLDEKLVNFDMITHGGAILLVKLIIDCIKSTVEEEMALQVTE